LKVFGILVAIASGVTLWIANTGPMPVWAILIMAGMFFTFASGRFIPGQAIVSLAVPSQRRGSFMSLASCTRDLTSGITSSLGGWIVTKSATGQLINYDKLGWLAVGMSVVSLWLASKVQVRDVHAPKKQVEAEVLG
jgi:MFS family permease